MRYEIGNKTYIQKPLVLGQIPQIADLLKGIQIPENTDISGMITMLGDRLGRALAIVLTEEGMPLKDKDLTAIEQEMESTVPLDTAMQVIEDFFDCNPIASLLERLSGTAGRITKKMWIPSSGKSAASSAKETSQSGIESSGDTRQENAEHTLNTVQETSP